MTFRGGSKEGRGIDPRAHAICPVGKGELTELLPGYILAETAPFCKDKEAHTSPRPGQKHNTTGVPSIQSSGCQDLNIRPRKHDEKEWGWEFRLRICACMRHSAAHRLECAVRRCRVGKQLKEGTRPARTPTRGWDSLPVCGDRKSQLKSILASFPSLTWHRYTTVSLHVQLGTSPHYLVFRGVSGVTGRHNSNVR